MWIFSKFGFFSVVDKGGDFHVRSRRRKDLENLVDLDVAARAETSPAGRAHPLPIHDTLDGDYCARVVVGRKVWIERLGPILLASIDYDNFKNSIAINSDQADKIPELHKIWSIMARYQVILAYGKGRNGLQASEDKFGGELFCLCGPTSISRECPIHGDDELDEHRRPHETNFDAPASWTEPEDLPEVLEEIAVEAGLADPGSRVRDIVELPEDTPSNNETAECGCKRIRGPISFTVNCETHADGDEDRRPFRDEEIADEKSRGTAAGGSSD